MTRRPVLLTALLVGACTSNVPTEPAAAEPSASKQARAFLGHGGGFRASDARLRVDLEPSGRVLVAATSAAFPIGLTTSQVCRGECRVSSGVKRVTGGSTAELARPLATETLALRADGLEQAWRFASEPAGQGALRVVVALDGARAMPADAEGVRLVSVPFGDELRYGHATWVDAKGVRTAVPVTVADGTLVMEVPEAVLAGSSWPAVLDPVVSVADFEVAGAAGALVDPPSAQDSVAMAGVADKLLAVWEDERYQRGRSRLLGAWVGDATASNPALINRFVLGTGHRPQRRPDIASGPNAFLVVWVEGEGAANEIRGVWVSSAGAVGTPFVIAATNNTEGNPQVAADPSTGVFVVTWESNVDVGPITAVRLMENGTTPVAGPVALTNGVSSKRASKVAFDGLRFVVVWDDNRAGTKIDLFGISFLPSTFPAASQGTQLLPTVTQSRTSPELIGGAAGQSLLTYPLSTTSTMPASRLNSSPLGAIDGDAIVPLGNALVNGYYESTTNQYRLFAMTGPSNNAELRSRTLRANDGGIGNNSIVEVSGLSSSGPVKTGRTPANGFDYGQLAWAEGEPGSTFFGEQNLRHRSFGTGGAVRFALGAESQDGLAAVSMGNGAALVGWAHHSGEEQTNDGGYDLGWRVLRADAGHGAPVVVARSGYQREPKVAVAGTRGLVVGRAPLSGGGRNGEDLVAAQVDLSTNTTQAFFTAALFANGPHAVTSAGGRFLVVWGENGGTNWALRSALLAATVTAHDGGFQERVYGAGDVSAMGFGAATGNGGLVAAMVGNPSGPFDVSAVRTFEDGGVSTSALAVGAARQVQADLSAPAVDFDGTNFLVAWVDSRNTATTGTDVYGARVSPAGTLIDAFDGVPLDVRPGNARDLSLSFNGRHHVLAVTQEGADGGTDVSVQWLRPDLSVLHAQDVATLENERGPALADLGNGHTLLAFTRERVAASVMANRATARVVKVGLGDVCTSAADCHSGFCTGGICCSEACTGACQTCKAAEGAPSEGTCAFRAAAFTCRTAAAGGCDVAETCTGSSATCPADAFAPPTTVCRPASMGGCDVAERCTGTGAACPADQIADAGTTCDSPTSPCAATGICPGTNDVCPVGGLKPANAPCRPVAGPCDVLEVCNGTSQACPTDEFLQNSAVCRPAAGACDLAESCTGSMAACPADQFKGNNEVCRNTAGACDVEERCTGGAAACPSDELRPSSYQCRSAAGVCDLAENCNGSSVECPTDAVKAAEELCRASGGECDAEERCDGVISACPTDATKRDGEVCQMGAGQCQGGVCQSLSAGQPKSRYGFGCNGCSAGGVDALFGVVALVWFARRRKLGAGLALSLVVLAAPAFAAAERPISMAFLGISNGAGVSQETARSISETTQTHLSNLGLYQVVGPSDIAALLGVERQKQLMGCSEGSCLAEVAGALDSERLVTGEVSRIDDTFIFNISMVNSKNGQVVGRVGRQVEGALSKLLGELEAVVYELANNEPSLGEKLTLEKNNFGGFVLGIRGDADMLGLRVAPAISVEYSWKWLGGALSVIPKATPGFRVEARGYPVVLKRVRPFVAAGLTGFSTGLAVRGAAGLAVRVWQLQLLLDAGYEYYFADFEPAANYSKHAVLVGLGVGWNF